MSNPCNEIEFWDMHALPKKEKGKEAIRKFVDMRCGVLGIASAIERDEMYEMMLEVVDRQYHERDLIRAKYFK